MYKSKSEINLQSVCMHVQFTFITFASLFFARIFDFEVRNYFDLARIQENPSKVNKLQKCDRNMNETRCVELCALLESFSELRVATRPK